MTRPPFWAYLVPAALSAAAVLRMPHAYYQVMPPVVCAAAGWIAVYKGRTGALVQAVIAAAIAIVFNPIVPLRMSRAAHAPINMIAAGFLITMLLLDMRRRAPDAQGPQADAAGSLN